MSLQYQYIEDVPQGSQQINNTQSPINGNFQDIASLIGVNHVPFNTLNDFGKHNFISYVQQDIDPSTTSGDMALYSKLASDGSLQLFVRYPSNGNIIQLTGSTSSSTASGSTAGSSYVGGTNPDGYQYGPGFYQYFPGGGFMMWGTISTSYIGVGNISTITAQVPIGPGIPVFSQTPLNMYFTTLNSVTNASANQGFPLGYGFTSINPISPTQFLIYNVPYSLPYSATWFAIGH